MAYAFHTLGHVEIIDELCFEFAYQMGNTLSLFAEVKFMISRKKMFIHCVPNLGQTTEISETGRDRKSVKLRKKLPILDFSFFPKIQGLLNFS